MNLHDIGTHANLDLREPNFLSLTFRDEPVSQMQVTDETLTS